MKKKEEFDYVIIGGGLAGMQLALAFAKKIFFEDKNIAIIEPNEKVENDRSWSFWEKGTGNWEKLIHHRWEKGSFISESKTYNLDLGKYSYKTIRSEDFYAHAKRQIQLSSNIVWISDSVNAVDGNEIFGEKENYVASLIFDSRVPENIINDKKSITIQQHFKGWLIETEDSVFDEETFVMMDYSVGYKNDCCFTYVLPFSKTKALVEFTFFTPDLVKDEVYDQLIKKYIEEQLKVTKYKVLETEQGNIPMSTYPFWQHNTDCHLKIGTAGGWVKASSGYSFKNVEKKVDHIIYNLQNELALDRDLFNKKYIFYDKVFLNVLYNENEIGARIFEEMYKKNSAKQILKFLDEETTFAEEIKIINRFSKKPFLKALRKII